MKGNSDIGEPTVRWAVTLVAVALALSSGGLAIVFGVKLGLSVSFAASWTTREHEGFGRKSNEGAGSGRKIKNERG